MNDNTKWEAVEVDAIKAGDTIRATHTSGSVVAGEALTFDAGAKLLMHGDSHARHYSEHNGWTFERAVPERTLPSEPGLYQSARINRGSGTQHAVTYRYSIGRWEDCARPNEEPDYLPDDLVRLVPVTEVEALRDRIAVARAYYQSQNFGDAHIDCIFELIDGTAS